MTTSGYTSFSFTRDQFISHALISAGIIYAGESISDSENRFCADTLNIMLLEWQAYDLHLWLKQELTLFLQKGQASYVIGAGSTDHITADTYIETQVTNATTSGSATIVLDSVTGMTAGDYIGVIRDDGYTYWTTIQSINVGTKTVTFASTTLSGDAAAGNYVHTYTNNATRPLKIFSTRRYEWSSQIDFPNQLLTREEYFNKPNKSQEGVPISWYYDPQEDPTGKIYIWMNPTDSSLSFKMTVSREIQTFLNASDTMDLPAEWHMPVLWGLSWRVAPAFGRTALIDKLKAAADESLSTLLAFDQESGSIFISPDMRSYRR